MKASSLRMGFSSRLASLTGCLVSNAVLTLGAITTLAEETPDAFTWQGASGADWFSPGAWAPSATSRTVPRIEGDTAAIGQNNYVTVSSNITLSALSVGSLTWDWKWVSFGALNSTEATMTFDAAGADPEALFLMATGRSEFWSPLKLHLDSPLKIKKGEYYNGKSIVRIAAPIEGGSPEAPAGLIVDGDIAVTLENSANSFYGDVQIGSADNTGEAVLALGYEWSSPSGTSAQLGNPTNRVILVNGDWKSQLFVGNAGGGSLSGRTVLGSGKIVGNYYNEWRFQNLNNLNLGAGTVIAPSNVLEASPYGTIVVYASSVSISPESCLALSLGTSSNDRVDYQISGNVALNSAIEVEEVDAGIPIGSVWDVITVKGNGAGFTFSPSSTPSNYFFPVSGNTTDGWTVKAVKIRNADGSSDRPLAFNAAPSSIGETNAVANVDVGMVEPDGTATLRVYYGLTDGGETPAAWTTSLVYPAAITQPGAYGILVSGLTLGETYVYRHSISNSAGEFFAYGANTFTTVPYSTPDAFTWIATNAQWFGQGVWSKPSNNARLHPQFAGDTVIFKLGGGRSWDDYGVNRHADLDGDATVGTLSMYEGAGNRVLLTATNGPAVLTFATPGQVNSYSNLGALQFGNGSDGLEVALAGPVHFLRTNPYDYNIYMFSKLSGGTPEHPSDIFLDTAANEWTHLYFNLFNTNNTFRGDLYVGTESTSHQAKTTLCLGGGPYWVNYPTDDAMCGDPANRIILRNRAAVRLCAPADAPARFARTLIGGGTLGVSNQRDQWNWDTRSLHLAFPARLEPSGTLAVQSVGLSADPDVRYVFSVSPSQGVSGQIAVSVSEPLTLEGTVEINPADESERIPVGSRWDIMTVAASATAFTPRLSNPPGYSIETSGDATTGWTVSAVKAWSGSVVLIH